MVDLVQKRRRIDSDDPKSLVKKQASFSDVLQQLEAEEDASGGMFVTIFVSHSINLDHSLAADDIETASAWPRPKVTAFDRRKDPISQLAPLLGARVQLTSTESSLSADRDRRDHGTQTWSHHTLVWCQCGRKLCAGACVRLQALLLHRGTGWLPQ